MHVSLYYLGSLVVQKVKNLPAMQETQVWPLGGRFPAEKNDYTLQYSCLEKPMDRGAWQFMESQKSWT